MISPIQPPQGRAQGSIVDRLRQSREAMGLSVEQLSVKTRIPTRHLETIESGRGRDLPGGFIGKSFVRQYAEAVGMDGEQALREFVAQTGVNLEVPFEERKISPFTPESIQKYHAKLWRNVGIGAVAVLAVVLMIVFLVTRPSKEPPAPQPAAQRPLPAYLEPEPLATGSTESTSPGSSTSGLADAASGSATPGTASSPMQANSATAGAGLPTTPAPPPARRRVQQPAESLPGTAAPVSAPVAAPAVDPAPDAPAESTPLAPR